MDASNWISLAAIGLTLATTVTNLIYTVKMSKRTEYISKLTDFRLRWIDSVRKTIAEYLMSIDRLQRADSANSREEYYLFLEKHWTLLSFLTTFSPREKKALELMEDIYDRVSFLSIATEEKIEENRELIQLSLLQANQTLRELMDQNWMVAKEEIEGKR